jgi:hypothetical protein
MGAFLAKELGLYNPMRASKLLQNRKNRGGE